MKNFSILIIDDSETDRYLLKREIQDAGLERKIFEAENGKRALEFLGQYDENRERHGELFPPLIIFVDINMPVLDGFGFLEEFDKLRNNTEGYQSCAVMMFTSSQIPGEREKATQWGFVRDYIVKGQLAPGELEQKIRGLAEDC